MSTTAEPLARVKVGDVLYRLRPLKWEKERYGTYWYSARVLDYSLEARRIDGIWHYAAPGHRGYQPAEGSLTDAKRKAEQAFWRYIELALERVE